MNSKVTIFQHKMIKVSLVVILLFGLPTETNICRIFFRYTLKMVTVLNKLIIVEKSNPKQVRIISTFYLFTL